MTENCGILHIFTLDANWLLSVMRKDLLHFSTSSTSMECPNFIRLKVALWYIIFALVFLVFLIQYQLKHTNAGIWMGGKDNFHYLKSLHRKVQYLLLLLLLYSFSLKRYQRISKCPVCVRVCLWGDSKNYNPKKVV